MRFAVLDVETANPRLSSICQIGAAVFEGRQYVDGRVWLVDPDDYFDRINESIHGITAAHVAGHPMFPTVWEMVSQLVGERPIIHHTHFDRSAVAQAHARYEKTLAPGTWLDSARIVRQAWPKYAKRGFGLSSLANDFGIEFRHHDALEDARAAGLILSKALDETGTTIAEWPGRLSSSAASAAWRASHTATGIGDGPLFGETVVFTGTLSMSRAEATKIAAGAGADVAPGVTKQTTLVVVGAQDIDRLAGKAKSEKHLKAEGLVAKGQHIRILTEDDLIAMLA